MDFLANQEGSAPFVTAAMHLDLVLGRVGVTRSAVGMPQNVLLPITPVDLRAIRRLLALEAAERWTIGGASFYRVLDNRFAVVGPAVGAPNAAAVMENLAALGARRLIAFGWCGSLQRWLKTGALVVPNRAIREEGTSYHYLPAGVVPEASPGLVETLLSSCEAAGRPATAGTVWTTDALYREARAKVLAFQAQGVLGVEMETSAIFAVGQHLGLETAVLLLVSDELGGGEWQVGFQDPAFRAAHEAACRIAIAAASTLR